MIDEVIQELWNAKDNIANEHNCSIDSLIEFYMQKQEDNREKFHHLEECCCVASKQVSIQNESSSVRQIRILAGITDKEQR